MGLGARGLAPGWTSGSLSATIRAVETWSLFCEAFNAARAATDTPVQAVPTHKGGAHHVRYPTCTGLSAWRQPMTQRYLSDVHRRLHESAVNEIREMVDRLPYDWVQILSLAARLIRRDVLHDEGGTAGVNPDESASEGVPAA